MSALRLQEGTLLGKKEHEAQQAGCLLGLSSSKDTKL